MILLSRFFYTLRIMKKKAHVQLRNLKSFQLDQIDYHIRMCIESGWLLNNEGGQSYVRGRR